ncbi:MAG TPA: hypothetical protein VHJ38_19865 [Nitrososphaeraceae archaeon]|nr:hypothetical protein [Nitrososphaeraceae archaeon]
MEILITNDPLIFLVYEALIGESLIYLTSPIKGYDKPCAASTVVSF